ncbi:MAG: hypothetical protein E7246_04695 [Lachnoclostridium sp.]|nr:hypothetical protein [Lachnoclostridium sp.]
MEKLYIRMFGELSLHMGDIHISDHNSRSRNVWLLIAYLLVNRGKAVSRSELVRVLWEGEVTSNNPEAALKIVLHRARTTLNRLWPSAGHQLIQYKNGGYSWNVEIPMVLDVDEFEEIYKKKCEDSGERMRLLQNAVALYRSEFLTKYSSEMWVMPLAAYYHNLYMKAVLELVKIMSEHGWHQEVVSICKNAMLIEAHHEPLHRQLMQAMQALGDHKGVVNVYEKLNQKMKEEIGVELEPETVALYEMALQTIQNNHVPMDEIREFLKEAQVDGALQCDYDYFKVLCHAESRALKRRGDSTHIALLTIMDLSGYSHSHIGLEHAAEQLGEQIRKTLRQSDAFTRCSKTQYIIMLPQASYENSHKICDRIISGYHRQHPLMHIDIRYQIKQLVPVHNN